jgi:hypothetical protein
MRLYTFEIYNKIRDLDGYIYNLIPKVDMIISLTLCQKKLECSNYIKDEIQKENETIIKDISDFEYREEVFFRITKRISKNKYEVEFYDYFKNNNVCILPCNVFYKYQQTKDEYKSEVSSKYIELYEEKNSKDLKKNKRNKFYMDDLLNNKLSFEDIVDKFNLDYYEILKLYESKYINDVQFKLGIKKILKINKEYKNNIKIKYNPDKNIEGTHIFSGNLNKSKWLKQGDKITCYLNNIHYIPIRDNKIAINKPFYYRFPIIENNAISDWNGIMLNKNILDHLIPGNIVRTCLTLIDKKTNKTITNMVLYFRIIIINNDIILGLVDDPYWNYALSEYNLEYIKNNFIMFNKRNISEIPISWNDNLKIFKLKKINPKYFISGYREETEGTQYDLFE